ncbi:MAG: hypothetical protein ACFFC7_19505 [Candidatus Hermodarchaeota archaeon]
MRYITPKLRIEGRLGRQPLQRWKVAVLGFCGRKASDGLVRALKAKPLDYYIFYGQHVFAESPFAYEAMINGKNIIILTRCIWGGPQAAILVEELAYLGIKYLVGHGRAGSIDPSLQLGQPVLASSALPTDGTTQAYFQKKVKPDSEMLNLALEAGKRISSNLKEVTVATVDALYRETKEAVKTWRSQGAQIINMETSPFYAASIMCDVKSVWIGYITDRLMDNWESWHWKRGEATILSETLCKELIQSVLSITKTQ